MNKLYRYYGIILLLSLVTAGCKKDEIVEYPVNFHEDRIEVKSAIRMFTHTGEIKDQAQIAEFVKNVPYFNTEDRPVQTESPSVTFLSGQEIAIGSTQRKFTVQRKFKQFLFYSAESIFGNEHRPGELKSELLKHRSPLTSNGPWGSVSKHVIVANGNIQELKFNLLAYHVLIGGNGLSWSSTAGLANNEFNEKALTTMKPGDKLAIKEYYLVCKAR